MTPGNCKCQGGWTCAECRDALESKMHNQEKVIEELHVQREGSDRLSSELTKDLEEWKCVARALHASHDGFGLSRIRTQLEKVGLIKRT